LRAYREAGIELVDCNPDRLPLVSLDVLFQAYPDREDQLHRPLVRRRLGLDGAGPWPAVLAGYVLNALDRTADDIRTAPHTVQAGDEFFPPRR
jgi:hypothetical protein